MNSINLEFLSLLVESTRHLKIEVYFEEYQVIDVRSDGRVGTSVSSSFTRGVGIRAVDEGRTGFAYTSDLSERALRATLAEAMTNARLAMPDGGILPDDPRPTPQGVWSHPSLMTCSVPELVELVHRMESGARAVAQCESVMSATLSIGRRTVKVVNSHAIAREFNAGYYNAGITVQTRDSDDISTGQTSVFGRDLLTFEPERMGRQAAHQGISKLGAKPIPTRKMPILLSPQAMTLLIGSMVPIFTGGGVAGRSATGSALGQNVASSLVTLTDDPLKSTVVGSGPFDGEGVIGERKVLIQQGELAGLLYNTRTACAVGLPRSTGSATRYAYSDIPSVGTSVVTLEQGDDTPESLIQSIEDGLLVTQLKGVSTGINPFRGTFSLGLVGRHIRHGEPAEAVADVVAGGFLTQLLRDIDGVGNDLWYRGPVGAPTVRVKSLQVIGR